MWKILLVAAAISGASGCQLAIDIAGGCPMKVPSLSGKFDGRCSPSAWQMMLSKKYDDGQPATTKNSKGERFPNEKCDLKLGTEYGFLNEDQAQAGQDLGSTMAGRMLRTAYYNATEACEGSGMPNCCINTKDKNGKYVFDSSACSSVLVTGADIKPLPNSYFAQKYDISKFAKDNYIFQMPSVEDPTMPSYRGNEFRRVGKQVHGKGQSCVEATFEVVSNLNDVLPRQFRVGLFSKAKTSYSAIVRLGGNKNFTVKDFHDLRVRSFALKLRNVKGQKVSIAGLSKTSQPENGLQAFGDHYFPPLEEEDTVDLLNIAIRETSDTVFNIFPAPNAIKYNPAFLNGAPPGVPLDHLNLFSYHPLNYTYGSGAAYALGKGAAMKMHFSPCPGEVEKLTTLSEDPNDPDFFFHNLKHTLENGDFVYCVYIQLQENPCTEVVEDATVPWHTESRLVAKLTLKQQHVYSYDAYCDNTVYHPYRTLIEHFPLGSIQRIRQPAYAFAQSYRLMINNGVKSDGTMGQTDPNQPRPKFSPLVGCTDVAPIE